MTLPHPDQCNTGTTAGDHRLAREARHRGQAHWLASRASMYTTPVLVATTITETVTTGHLEPNHLLRIASGAAVAFTSAILCRRWDARAEWFATTPNWHERLDEAPTILAFPRLHAAIHRRLDRWRQRRSTTAPS